MTGPGTDKRRRPAGRPPAADARARVAGQRKRRTDGLEEEEDVIDLSATLEYHARVTPQRPALLYGGEVVTYAALSARVGSLAGWLAARGVAKGSVVGLVMKNSAAFFELSFAVSYLGAVLLPINYRLARPEIEHIVADGGAGLLVCDEEFAPALAGMANLFAVPEGALSDTSRFSAGHGRPPRAYSRPEDLFRLMYTSGTTGHPKGVMHSYSNFYWKNMSLVIAMELSARDRIFCSGPLYHVGAFDAPASAVLWLGGTVFVQREFDAPGLAEAIGRHGLTGGWLAPVMLARLQEALGDGHDVSSLRFIIGGGGATAEKAIHTFNRLFPNARYINGFGLTETCSSDTYMDPGFEISKIKSLGRALPHVEVRIGDTRGEPQPTGVEGEILLRGPKVTQGYWKAPEKNNESFFGEWFRTGDVGYLDDEGFLYMTDRMKDMIKSGGENIASSEIERVVVALPQVAEVAVVAQADETWGQIPVAFVTLQSDASLTPEEVDRHCRRHLAGFKVPKKVIFTDSLPRNPSGKVLKHVLRDSLSTAGSTV